ncbi:MAG: hypothetical protein ACAI44_32655, partial [Candidatus Sericytochromatia bacterium]
LNPSSEPLPQDYKLGDLGAFKYIQFDYDGRTFKGQWSTDNLPDKKVTVQHYLPRRAAEERDQQSFELEWDPAWENDVNGLVRAMVKRYLDVKSLRGNH